MFGLAQLENIMFAATSIVPRAMTALLVGAQPATQLPTAGAVVRIVASEEFPEPDGMIWVLQKREQTPQ